MVWYVCSETDLPTLSILSNGSSKNIFESTTLFVVVVVVVVVVVAVVVVFVAVELYLLNYN